jgi:CubicO group peptidase (beta-lactamase class C family)
MSLLTVTGLPVDLLTDRRQRVSRETDPIMSELQAEIQAAVDRLVETGAERGVQVSVYRHGEPVAEAVAGVADPETGRLVTPGTPFYNYSIGKGATSAVAHVLVERGAFSYDTPVVDLWPEYGAHGKQATTVRHVLTHTAGVPGLPADITAEDICDWDRMCALVADAEPWWEPGTKTGYHSYTFGYLVGEIVQRATGKRISQVLREEITEPLGVADELYFGVPLEEQARLARLEDDPNAGEMPEIPADHPMLRSAPLAIFPTAELGNRADVLAADIPAGAKTSARAIARLYAALLGEVDGVRLVSPERLRELSAVAFSGIDEVFGNPASWGLGYAIGRPGEDDESPTATVFGMAGAGGSAAYADTASGITFALTKNRITMDFEAVNQVSEIIGKLAVRA